MNMSTPIHHFSASKLWAPVGVGTGSMYKYVAKDEFSSFLSQQQVLSNDHKWLPPTC